MNHYHVLLICKRCDIRCDAYYVLVITNIVIIVVFVVDVFIMNIVIVIVIIDEAMSIQ